MGKVGEVRDLAYFYVFESVDKKLTLHSVYAIIILAVSKRNTLIFNVSRTYAKLTQITNFPMVKTFTTAGPVRLQTAPTGEVRKF